LFTGIVEDTGVIKNLRREAKGRRFFILSKISKSLSPGESISVDGACLTVEEVSEEGFSVFLSQETLSITKFGRVVRPGLRVNLERALRVGDRLGGHIVMGHVDTVGRIKKIVPKRGSALWELSLPNLSFRKYLVKKGSIAIDGVSLTITDLTSEGFSVELIPYTLEKTNFPDRKIGDYVNLEFDILSKYVENILRAK